MAMASGADAFHVQRLWAENWTNAKIGVPSHAQKINAKLKTFRQDFMRPFDQMD